MDDNEKKFGRMIAESEVFEEAGEFEKALEIYSKILDILVERGKQYAGSSGPGIIEAVVGSGVIQENYLKKFNEYLKKDKTAAEISSRMGKTFAKMGNNASAKAFFEQAIDLTPPGVEYSEPHIGLEMIKERR